jgi:hypothetical protein
VALALALALALVRAQAQALALAQMPALARVRAFVVRQERAYYTLHATPAALPCSQTVPAAPAYTAFAPAAGSLS